MSEVAETHSGLRTSVEAARYLRTSQSTLSRLVTSGRLPVIKLGRRTYRYRIEDLQALIGSAATAGEPCKN